MKRFTAEAARRHNERVAGIVDNPAAAETSALRSESDFIKSLIDSCSGVFRFMVRCDPMGAPRQTRRDKWKARPCVIRYRALCDQIRSAAGNLVAPEPAIVFAKFYIAMPPSWSEKKRTQMEWQPHRARPDTDNLLKGLKDALLAEDGCVYGDIGLKYWCREGDQRIECALFYQPKPVCLSVVY